MFIRDNNIEESGLEMRFAWDYEAFGVVKTHELVPNGNDKIVTEENKLEYIEWEYIHTYMYIYTDGHIHTYIQTDRQIDTCKWYVYIYIYIYIYLNSVCHNTVL